MAASTVHSAPQRPALCETREPLPSGREGSPARAPAPSQSLGGSQPQPESCHLTRRSLGLQVPARTRPPGDRRGGVPASTRRRAPGPSPCSGSVGSPLSPCAALLPRRALRDCGAPSGVGAVRVRAPPRPLRTSPSPKDGSGRWRCISCVGVTAGPSPQCWVVLGAAAQRGHWAEAQGCGSGPLDLWGSQSWDPLVGRHAERYGPRRRAGAAPGTQDSLLRRVRGR